MACVIQSDGLKTDPDSMDSGKGTRKVRRCAMCGDPLSNDSEACVDLISQTHFFSNLGHLLQLQYEETLRRSTRFGVHLSLSSRPLSLNISMSSCCTTFWSQQGQLSAYDNTATNRLACHLHLQDYTHIQSRAVRLRNRLACRYLQTWYLPHRLSLLSSRGNTGF